MCVYWRRSSHLSWFFLQVDQPPFGSLGSFSEPHSHGTLTAALFQNHARLHHYQTLPDTMKLLSKPSPNKTDDKHLHVHANMKVRAEILKKLHECAYLLRPFSCEIQACFHEKRMPASPHALWALRSEHRQVLPQLLFDEWPGFATIRLDMLGHGLAESEMSGKNSAGHRWSPCHLFSYAWFYPRFLTILDKLNWQPFCWLLTMAWFP